MRPICPTALAFSLTLFAFPASVSSLQSDLLPVLASRARRRKFPFSLETRGGGNLKNTPGLSTTSLINGPNEQATYNESTPSLVAIARDRDTSIAKNRASLQSSPVPPPSHKFTSNEKLPWYRYIVPSAHMLPELLAELFGTFLLLQLALGIVSSALIAGSMTGVFPIAVLTGGAITVATAAVSSRCAAHFNPAISLAMCVHRKFGWTKLVPYSVAQVLGAALAAAVNFGMYSGHIRHFEASHGIVRAALQGVETAKMTACYYDPTLVSSTAAFLAETFGTFMLSSTVFALTSEKNTQVKGLFIPPIIGSVVALIIAIIGPITCASLNPARELGPRLILRLFGWSTAAFHQVGLYLIAPFVGATLGGWFVDHFLYGDYHAPTSATMRARARENYSAEELRHGFQ